MPAYAPASRLTLSARGFDAEVALVPGRAGANGATAVPSGPDGRPVEVPEVALRLSNPGRGIAPLGRPARRESAGLWSVPELTLAVPGAWEVELDVLVSDFERQTMTAKVELE